MLTLNQSLNELDTNAMMTMMKVDKKLKQTLQKRTA